MRTVFLSLCSPRAATMSNRYVSPPWSYEGVHEKAPVRGTMLAPSGSSLSEKLAPEEASPDAVTMNVAGLPSSMVSEPIEFITSPTMRASAVLSFEAPLFPSALVAYTR